MNLGRQVRFHRFAKGWGPAELASRAQISRATLFQIERGRTAQPRALTVERLARALEVEVDALLHAPAPGRVAAPAPAQPAAPDGGAESLELGRKFCVLLASPIGGWLASLVEETYQWLPLLERHPAPPEADAPAASSRPPLGREANGHNGVFVAAALEAIDA